MIRERVEVLVIKGREILFIDTSYDGVPVIHLPGGGLDDHSLTQAALLETKEETGYSVSVDILMNTEYSESSFGSGYKAWRAEVYDGVRTRFVIASVLGRDSSLLGLDDDHERCFFIDINEAIDLIECRAKDSPWPLNRLEILNEALTHL